MQEPRARPERKGGRGESLGGRENLLGATHLIETGDEGWERS